MEIFELKVNWGLYFVYFSVFLFILNIQGLQFRETVGQKPQELPF